MEVSLRINIIVFLGTKWAFWCKLQFLSIRKPWELQETKVNMLNQAAHLCPHAPGIPIAQSRNLAKHITAFFCPSGCLCKGEGSGAGAFPITGLNTSRTKIPVLKSVSGTTHTHFIRPVLTSQQTWRSTQFPQTQLPHAVRSQGRFFPMTLGFCLSFMEMLWMAS